MNNDLNHKIEVILTSIIVLERLTDFDERLSKLEEVNNHIIDFLNEINLLPNNEFVYYNQQLNKITPKLEQVMNDLIADKQKIVTQVEAINNGKKALKIYEDA